MEQMDDKETTSSRLKILDAEYEIPSASKLERPTLRCSEHEMPGHDKLYNSKDCQDRCEKDATRCQDFPDDRVSQRVDAMIVARTARRADVMIGSYSPGDADSTIGYLTSKITPTADVVINLGPIAYIILNAILILLLLLMTSGVVMTFSGWLHSTNMEFVSTRVRFRPSGG